MAIPVDISCPDCGRVEPVRKRSLDRYRCSECGAEFGPADVRPEE